MVKSGVSCGLFRDYPSGIFKARKLHHSLLSSTMKKSGTLKMEIGSFWSLWIFGQERIIHKALVYHNNGLFVLQ